MPPEALDEDPHYGTELDIFSYGVLMLRVCSGDWPVPSVRFHDVPLKRIRSEVERRQEYFDKIGPNHPLRSLIMECLSNDPARRPSVSQLLYRLNQSGRYIMID